MQISNEAYLRRAEGFAPKSKTLKNCVKAFAAGGLICLLGELFRTGALRLGLSQKEAGTAASVALIFLSALLTGLSVYDNIAKHAGAGTLVPITGFANSIAAPAVEFKSEGLITGTAVKMFTIAGPVLVFGLTASVVYGVIYWLGTL